MSFRIAPLEKRDGFWRVNFLSLFLWVVLFNLAFMALLSFWPASRSEAPVAGPQPVSARAMKHPVVVLGKNVPLFEAANDTAVQLAVLQPGDTVDLYVAQPAGWHFVTLPDAQLPDQRSASGYSGGRAGYIRQEFLQVPDSTLQNIKQQR